MANGIEKIQRDLMDLKRDIEFIKHVVSEDFELSPGAKKDLIAARATPKSKYVNIDELD